MLAKNRSIGHAPQTLFVHSEVSRGGAQLHHLAVPILATISSRQYWFNIQLRGVLVSVFEFVALKPQQQQNISPTSIVRNSKTLQLLCTVTPIFNASICKYTPQKRTSSSWTCTGSRNPDAMDGRCSYPEIGTNAPPLTFDVSTFKLFGWLYYFTRT